MQVNDTSNEGRKPYKTKLIFLKRQLTIIVITIIKIKI